MNPQICRGSGDMGYVWKDGLFETVYCICGAKITVTEGMQRVGKDNKYIHIPEHQDNRNKQQFVSLEDFPA